MKKIFGTLNHFEVSNNSVFELFSSENYCPHILPLMLLLSVCYQKFYFEKCPKELNPKKQVCDSHCQRSE